MATTTATKPTVHEMLSLNEVIRLESMEVQKLRAILPMVSDNELRSELESCVQTGQQHLRALVEFCKQAQLTQ